MNNTPLAAPRLRRCFTLIELLVVIAIIGILASLLLVVIQKAIVRGKITKARQQITDIVSAISRYDTTYGHYPGVIPAGPNDYSYAGMALVGGNPAPPSTWQTSNAEVIAILMDLEKYPGSGLDTSNVGHAKNTQQTKFLTANMVSDSTLPGVGPDLIYRDPWASPYVISMDLNYDEKCQDVLYQYRVVSQQTAGQATGLNGLFNSKNPSGVSDDYEYHGGVMVWSLGPDHTVDFSKRANEDVNKDNILSWKP